MIKYIRVNILFILWIPIPLVFIWLWKRSLNKFIEKQEQNSILVDPIEYRKSGYAYVISHSMLVWLALGIIYIIVDNVF